MKNIFKSLILFSISLLSLQAFSQQVPHFTQFMYNMNVVNPAYAGIKNGLAGGVLYRTQWAGAEGHPVSLTVNLHSPIGDKMGVGISGYNDKFGFDKQNNFKIDYSYKLQLDADNILALGLNLGFWQYRVDLTQIDVVDPGDPLLNRDINDLKISYGIGALLYSDHYYVGVSLPNLNTSAFMPQANRWTKGNVIHYFITGGYVFDLNENFKLKPHVMLYQAIGAPMAVDLNTNLFMYDKVEVGASYRVGDSFSGLINVLVTPNLRIGYAYDRTLSDMKLYSPNTHEFFLNFIIPYKHKAFMSPLYF